MKQNIWIKLCILMLGSIAALAIPIKALLALLFITFAYLLMSPSILKYVLSGLKVILPFFAAYSLLATVFGLSLSVILTFNIRILILVVLVTYFSSSFRMQRFLEDSRYLNRKPLLKPLLFYASASLIFMRNFTEYYARKADALQTKSFDISKIVTSLIDAIHENWLQINSIQTETEALLAVDFELRIFFSKINILGCAYITLIILSLSF